MTDAAEAHERPRSGRGMRPLLLLLLPTVLMAGAGFFLTYRGHVTLPAFGAHEQVVAGDPARPRIEFVDIPQIVLTTAGPAPRMLVITVKLETDGAHRKEIEHLVPRLQDMFNSFLSDIDGSAFEKRGILDIIRDELATRAVLVLGKDAFTDLLITEFRVQ
ncbi:flagellar basal body-associated FliL family protein [Paracoccus sp. (in: a-proteobacteria)]|uniref:flagellar basal body-associated FliL family protein n=1 Tax=Paracoccus sp. TaxID=267 RepID=UPI00321FE893